MSSGPNKTTIRWDRECVVCGHKWLEGNQQATDCPACSERRSILSAEHKRELDRAALRLQTTDADAWTPARIVAEVEFAVSAVGRLRREDREVAFADEITRLRAQVSRIGTFLCGGHYAEALRVALGDDVA